MKKITFRSLNLFITILGVVLGILNALAPRAFADECASCTPTTTPSTSTSTTTNTSKTSIVAPTATGTGYGVGTGTGTAIAAPTTIVKGGDTITNPGIGAFSINGSSPATQIAELCGAKATSSKAPLTTRVGGIFSGIGFDVATQRLEGNDTPSSTGKTSDLSMANAIEAIAGLITRAASGDEKANDIVGCRARQTTVVVNTPPPVVVPTVPVTPTPPPELGKKPPKAAG